MVEGECSLYPEKQIIPCVLLVRIFTATCPIFVFQLLPLILDISSLEARLVNQDFSPILDGALDQSDWCIDHACQGNLQGWQYINNVLLSLREMNVLR